MKNNSKYILNKNDSSIIDFIRNNGKTHEKQMDPLERKRTGSYYTDLDLTDIMMEELVSYIFERNKEIWNLRFLEPCVGSGNFVFSYLRSISKLGLSKSNLETLINNIFVADINTNILVEYEKMLSNFVYHYFNIKLDKNYFQTNIGSALLFDVTSENINYIKITDVFPKSIVAEGFDIVVTNPPYKNLKAERGQYYSEADYNIDREKYSEISKLARSTFKYSVQGVLNLYKLFVEEIIENYTNKDGFISLLIPSSILTDKTCSNLRTRILEKYKIDSIKVLNEGNGYINAQQALCTLLIHKGCSTEYISMTGDFVNNPSQTTKININDIMNPFTENSIFSVNDYEYELLKQLRLFPTVKELDFIINLRGELDLTANKNEIISIDNGYPLIRGRNIGYYKLTDCNNNEFVSDDFIKKSNKLPYIKNERIICQQVVNMKKERRITFTLVEKNKILGNSCNFISVLDNDLNIDLYAILGLFNSSIINWFFKLTSSNNHVNNYEIDCFPVPTNSKYLPEISRLVKGYLNTYDDKLLEKIEECVHIAYGLKESKNDEIFSNDNNHLARDYYKSIKYIIPVITFSDAQNILSGSSSLDSFLMQNRIELSKFNTNVANGITDKYIKLSNNQILNHTTFKLSELDLEMIKPVPPGGSWKDIPMETVVKSKRLKKITETGGRTTLYGRIDYEKPSYTITTYFNRPGNGTYVHPVHDRVLSVREAARFQCFKDDYYFWGNQTQILRQVGNAVPTILAYQIAKQITSKIDCRTSIDLFSGAGGLTAGFKEAGIEPVLCNDFDEAACTTLKINNPELDVYCDDITLPEVKEHIINVSKNNNIDIICGGPPCQGFSLAGFRLNDDPRNQLFKDFIEIVENIKPKVIVFENVMGILSFQKGKVFQAILDLFSEVGYNIEARTLMATDYAVPQKRKRVFIICTRNDLQVTPSDLFPDPITLDELVQISAKDTIKDLEEVECNPNASYIEETYNSNLIKVLKSKITYDDYVAQNSLPKKPKIISDSIYEEDSTGQMVLSI